MIQRTAISLICLLWATAAQTQDIPVQSGDHGGFTRLVAAIGSDRDWQVMRDGRRLTISFTPAATGFDLSEVFTLITRDRVADVQSDAGLVIELGCDCSVDITRYLGRYAVDRRVGHALPAPCRTRTCLGPARLRPGNHP